MVTEIVNTDGKEIPAPSLTVITMKRNTDDHQYTREAEACMNNSNSLAMECIENIGDKIEDLFMFPVGWTRYFGVLGGWLYHRKGILSMKNIDKDTPLIIGVNNTRLQVYMHDEKEILNYYSDVKNFEVSEESQSVFLKVHKIQKVNNCEASLSYSFSKCVENYIAKVSIIL